MTSGDTPIPVGTHTLPWGTRKPGSHEQTPRACAWGEGVTSPARPPARPPARSLTPCLACNSASLCFLSASSSSSAMARLSHVAQAQRPSGVAQPQPPSGTLGWNRFGRRLEPGAFDCADASDAQASKVECRVGAAGPRPGCLAEDRSCDGKRGRTSKRALVGSQALNCALTRPTLMIPRTGNGAVLQGVNSLVDALSALPQPPRAFAEKMLCV